MLLLKGLHDYFQFLKKQTITGIRPQGSGNDFSAQVKCNSCKPDFSKNSFSFPLTDTSYPSYDLLSMVERGFRSVDSSTGGNCLVIFLIKCSLVKKELWFGPLVTNHEYCSSVENIHCKEIWKNFTSLIYWISQL